MFNTFKKHLNAILYQLNIQKVINMAFFHFYHEKLGPPPSPYTPPLPSNPPGFTYDSFYKIASTLFMKLYVIIDVSIFYF